MNIFLSYARQLRIRHGSKTRRGKKSTTLNKAPILIQKQAEPYTLKLGGPQYEKDLIICKQGSPPSYHESCQAAVTEKLMSEKVSITSLASFNPTHPRFGQSSHHAEYEKNPTRGRPKELLYRSQLSDLRSRESKLPYPRRRVGRVPRSLVIDEGTMTRLQLCLTSWREESTAMLYFVALLMMCSSFSSLFV